MRIFLYEWKKMLFYNRGIWIILAVLAAQLAFWALSDTPVNEDIEAYREEYMYFLDSVEGELTQDKADWIEAAASETAAASSQITQLYLDYYGGLVTDDDYEMRLASLSEAVSRHNGMNALYEQYMYAREDPESRYMLYPNGWDALLDDDSLNVFLVVLLLLLVVPLFVREYQFGMDKLAVTMPHGNSAFGWQKSLVSCLSAALSCIVVYGERLLFCEMRYGISNGGFPVQSLEYFASCPYEISLSGVFASEFACRILGAVFAAALICLLSSLTRQYAATCLWILGIMLIPYVALGDSVQYLLPLPLALLRAAGFWSLDGMGDLLPVMAMTAIVAIFACLVLVRARDGSRLGKKPRYRGGCMLFAIILASACCMSGCGSAIGESLDVPYNSCSPNLYLDDDMRVEANSDEGTVMLNGGSGEMDLVRSPLSEGESIADLLFCDGDTIYYMTVDETDTSGIRLSQINLTRSVYVIGISPETMEEKCVFETSRTMGQGWDFIFDLRGFFLNEKYIWFVTTNGSVWQVNLATHRKSVMDFSADLNLAFDGNGIFYLDSAMRLCRYDCISGVESLVGDVAAGRFVMTGDGIWFSNLRDNNSLYYCDFDGKGQRKVDDGEVTSLAVSGGLLEYYVNGERRTLDTDIGM